MVKSAENHVFRKLVAADAPAYRALWLKALKDHPAAFYKTYEDERGLGEDVWRERCTEVANKQCAFGIFRGQRLSGIVRIIRGHGDVYDGQAVLSRLYIEKGLRDKKHELLDLAKQWTAEQSAYSRIYAATTSAKAQDALLDAGFVVNGRTTTIKWPATGKYASHTWHAFELDALRPVLSPKVAAGIMPSL